MATWTLYYEDGRTFSSEDGEPNDSPPYGVVLATQPGVIVGGHFDNMIHRTDAGWLECDLVGLIDQLTHFAPLIDCVRIGRWIPTPQWKALLSQARDDLRG